jgi:cobalt transporter subunit CbtB
VSTHSIDTDNQPATQSAAQSAIGVAANHKFSAFLAAMLGLVIVFGVSFAPSEVVHNAAHDGRHSLSVPCH